MRLAPVVLYGLDIEAEAVRIGQYPSETIGNSTAILPVEGPENVRKDYVC